MVAHLLKLRLLLLKNAVTRSVWQLIGVIVGAVYALGMLAVVVVGMIALASQDVELVRTLITLAGAALVLGWVIGPILVTGSDQSLDLATLATFPIPRRTLMLGLAAAGVVGIPGIVTSLAALASALAWIGHPIGILPALLCAVIGVVTCVVGSRLVAAAATGLASSRRYKEVLGGVLLIFVVLLGPIIFSIMDVVRGGLNALPAIANTVSWTPLGAIWAVPGEVVAGHWGLAAAKSAIGVVTLLGLFALWALALRHALAEPAASSAGGAAGARGIGLFGRFPGTPTGAVAARALGYWLRDPRYSRGLLIVPAILVLTIFYSSLGDGGAGFWTNAAPVIVAVTFGVTLSADVAYDGTAWAMHVSSGVSGAADRGGRVIAAAIVGVPLVVVTALITAAFSNSWAALPGLIGLSLALLLSGFGLSSVLSARVVYPVPAPGDNPFKSPPGAGMISSVLTFGGMAGCAVLAIPSIVLAVISFVTGGIAWGVAALVVGVVLGSFFARLGVRLGGRIVDAKAPELFASLIKLA
ncbi:transporter [Microbacteriaceae bacterium VKM Ac-2855]|nr:transporter [Microbacteriaceae bacterium VKM Ac-2855]